MCQDVKCAFVTHAVGLHVEYVEEECKSARWLRRLKFQAAAAGYCHKGMALSGHKRTVECFSVHTP
jgi:hypothetical protein